MSLPITVSVCLLFVGLSSREPSYMLGEKLQLQGRLPALPCACLGFDHYYHHLHVCFEVGVRLIL